LLDKDVLGADLLDALEITFPDAALLQALGLLDR
jgi:hypothetical protein